MSLSVIIIAHNNIPSIKNCLEAVESQLLLEDELILLDNGSNDLTDNVIEEFVPIRGTIKKTFLKQNVGISIGRNLLAGQAKGEILVFLDADIILHENALAALRKECLTADAIVGAYMNKGPGLIWYREIKYRSLSKKKLGDISKVINRHFFTTLSGGLCAIRSDVFKGIGGFRASFSCGALEDIDLELRLLYKGYTVKFCGMFNGVHEKDGLSFSEFCRWCWRCGIGNANVFAEMIKGSYLLPNTRYYPRLPGIAPVLCFYALFLLSPPVSFMLCISAFLYLGFPFFAESSFSWRSRLFASFLFIVDECITFLGFVYQSLRLLAELKHEIGQVIIKRHHPTESK